MSRDAVVYDFQQQAMDACYEQMLFQDVCASKKAAEATGEFADYRYAAKAYVRYMRFHLTDPEREVLRLEDEVARLSAENANLKRR